MKAVKRLIDNFVPDSYKLFLHPDRETMTFEGRVIIAGKKTGRPSRRITFHQNGLKVSAAKLIYKDRKKGGVSIEVTRSNLLPTLQELRIHTAENLIPGEYEIELSFSGRINENMHGLYASRYRHEGKDCKIIATQFESHHAREVFPCIDEPAAKAVFELSVSTPAGEVVLSNTPIKTREEEGDYILTSFEPTPKMSTYLLAFAYGNLVYKESINENGVVIRSYCIPEHVELLDFSLDTAVRSVAFFERYFGVAYPLPKLDLLALPDFAAGAMENWGLITFRESYLLVHPETTSVESKQYAALVIAHEIAHQWFGNLVTMKWWDDLWLNESFANLMEYRAVDDIFPQWQIWEHFVNAEYSSALRRDSLPNVQPVKTGVAHPDEISTLFDPSIVYAKGGSLLHMLMHKIGEDNFKEGLRDYFLKHSYGNTTADDLWQSLSEASGLNLYDFMKPWLTRPGFPALSISVDKKLQLKQRRLVIGSNQQSEEPWPLPLATSKPLAIDMMADKETSVEIAGTHELPVFNHLARSYYVTDYEDKLLDSFTASIKSGRMAVIDRLLLLQSCSLLERAGLKSTADNLALIEAYRHERSESVWNAIAVIIASGRRLVFETEAEAIMKRFQADLVKPVTIEIGWDGEDDDSSQIRRLREILLTLAASAEIDPVIREGLERYAKFKKPADISPDIRSPIYFIAARYGTLDDFDRLLAAYSQSSSADEKEEICAGLTSAKDGRHIKKLIGFLTENNVRLQDIPSWYGHLISNPYAKDRAWEWMVNNWDWLEKNYRQSGHLDIFPRYAASAFSRKADEKKYKDFFGKKIDDPALSRAVTLGLEDIAGKVAWRLRNERTVTDWLKSWQAAVRPR